MSKRGGGGDDRDTDFIEILEGAKKFWDSHGDGIKKVFDSGDSVDLSDQEPLREVHKDEEEAKLICEVKGETPNQVRVGWEGNDLIAQLNDETVIATMPSDVVKDSLEANVKNNVLRIVVEREDYDMEEVTIEETDESLE